MYEALGFSPYLSNNFWLTNANTMCKFSIKSSLILAIILGGICLISCKKETKEKEQEKKKEKEQSLQIFEKLIQFDSLRTALSLEYMKEHHGLKSKQANIDPKIIVIHHTVLPSLDSTFEAFDPPTLPGNRVYIQKSSALNVSSQFGIDRDGSIYRFLPDTVFARHVIGLNHCAIGIENVGGTPELPLTAAQLASNIQLVKFLSKKYPIEYVIGHHEYQAFIGHKLWKETDPNYLTDKSDPGELFMKQLREGLKDHKLKGAPHK